MTAPDHAARIAAKLTRAQRQVLRDAAADKLIRDSHYVTRSTTGTVQGRTLTALLGWQAGVRICLALIQIDGHSSAALRQWRATDTGRAVLAHLDGADPQRGSTGHLNGLYIIASTVVGLFLLGACLGWW